MSLEAVEAVLIRKALARANGNVSHAADALGLSVERFIAASKNMGFEEPAATPPSRHRRRVPLRGSGRRLSFEKRLRLWLYLLGLPMILFCWFLLHRYSADLLEQFLIILALVLGWVFAVSLLMDQIIRPMQTLANVVAALREDDYSFRARGGQRNDAIGDLALEVNRLASMLQAQRAGALEAMALVERVMGSMQSPVLAFDPEGKLRLLNAAAEREFNLRAQTALGHSAAQLNLHELLDVEDDGVISLGNEQQSHPVDREADKLPSPRHSPHPSCALRCQRGAARRGALRLEEIDSRPRTRNQQLSHSNQIHCRQPARPALCMERPNRRKGRL